MAPGAEIALEVLAAAAHEPPGADHRPDIADHQPGLPRVGLDHAAHEGIFPSRAVQQRDRQAEAFLVDIPCGQLVHPPGHVGHMCGGAEEGNHPAVPEDRHDHVEVRQVPVADPRIVGHQHVALLQGLDRMAFQHGPGRPRQRGGEGRHADLRLGDAAPLRVHQHDGIVAGLADDGGEGRVQHRDVGLVHDRYEPAPLDLQVNGADGVLGVVGGGGHVGHSCVGVGRPLGGRDFPGCSSAFLFGVRMPRGQIIKIVGMAAESAGNCRFTGQQFRDIVCFWRCAERPPRSWSTQCVIFVIPAASSPHMNWGRCRARPSS